MFPHGDLCRENILVKNVVDSVTNKEEYEVATLVNWKRLDGILRTGNTPISSLYCSGLTTGQNMLRKFVVWNDLEF